MDIVLNNGEKSGYYFSSNKNSADDILMNLPVFEVITYLWYASYVRNIELPEEFSEIPEGEFNTLLFRDEQYPFKFVKFHDKLIITRYRLHQMLYYIPAFIIVDNNERIDFENFGLIYRYYMSEKHDYNILFVEQLSDIPMAIIEQKV